MYCPYCGKEITMVVMKHDYHQRDNTTPQPYNTFLTVLYECLDCGVTVETSQQVRITNVKKE